MDIIDKVYFSESYYSNHDSFYSIQNLTRDCIKEICLAENKCDVSPENNYLKNWRKTASPEWLELSNEIEKIFNEREQLFKHLKESIVITKQKLSRAKDELLHTKNAIQDLSLDKKITKIEANPKIILGAIFYSLIPSLVSWTEKESKAMQLDENFKEFPKFESNINNNLVSQNKSVCADIEKLNKEIVTFNQTVKQNSLLSSLNRTYCCKLRTGYQNAEKDSVIQRIKHILNWINFPDSIPKTWDIDFDQEQKIALVEIKLPDVIHNQVLKMVKLKTGLSFKPLNQKEIKEEIPKIHPIIILRIAYEIFRNDYANIIKLLVINGWVEFSDPNTGKTKQTYTASVAVEKHQVIDLILGKLDPIAAFSNLNGKSAGKLIDIVPVVPALSLNKDDKRFIEAKEIISDLDSRTNLAAMDWQDFEHLIRELFEKYFCKTKDSGVEVKITQASRDRGVDAIVFDPDPIKGGKFVIQAKRYTNTVDASAVRDLCAVVRKEGASRGILVTTSSYGADAYAFANNEPIALLNGAELLGLLEQYGYSFRIDLQEAKKLNASDK